MSLVTKAAMTAIVWHGKQERKYSHIPYVAHCAHVAHILSVYGIEDEELLAAAWLHDVLEDTEITWASIATELSPSVADLVQEVTDVSRPEDGNRKTRKEIDRNHLAKASPRAQTLKLADMISNALDIAFHDPNFAKVYMGEVAETMKLMTEGHPELYSDMVSLIRQYKEKGHVILRIPGRNDL